MRSIFYIYYFSLILLKIFSNSSIFEDILPIKTPCNSSIWYISFMLCLFIPPPYSNVGFVLYLFNRWLYISFISFFTSSIFIFSLLILFIGSYAKMIFSIESTLVVNLFSISIGFFSSPKHNIGVILFFIHAFNFRFVLLISSFFSFLPSL